MINFFCFFELIDGEIVEKVPTEEHGLIAGNIYGFFWQYTRQSGFSHTVIEVRVRMPEDDYNSSQSDLAFFVDTTRPVVNRGPVLQMLPTHRCVNEPGIISGTAPG